jgi:hypothetical protein
VKKNISYSMTSLARKRISGTAWPYSGWQFEGKVAGFALIRIVSMKHAVLTAAMRRAGYFAVSSRSR